MKDQGESKSRKLTELFSAMKSVVADNLHIQEMIRMQEGDNRQVLVNMSSVLRLVEQDEDGTAGDATLRPSVVSGWVAEAQEAGAPDSLDIGEADEAGPDAPGEPSRATGGNFFDRAFLKSLKISS